MDLGIRRTPGDRLRRQQGAGPRLCRGAGRERRGAGDQRARCATRWRRRPPRSGHDMAWTVTAVAADVATEEGRAALLAACPDPDILVNNAGGPPPGDFRDWGEEAWLAALRANMLAPIALIRAVVDGMGGRGFGRIVNITSAAVKAPIPELGLSNGARAGLTGLVGGVARQVAGKGVTINNILPGPVRDRPAQGQHRRRGAAARRELRGGRARRGRGRAGRPVRRARRVRPALRLPVLDPCRLHHRPEPADRRRRLPGAAVSAGRADAARSASTRCARHPSGSSPD